MNSPPMTLSPSPLCRCTSYHDTGPVNGWWELIMSRVEPSRLRDGATAVALEPNVMAVFGSCGAGLTSCCRVSARSSVSGFSNP